MEKRKRRDVFCEVKCPVCGKMYIPAPEHIYKDKRTPRRVCSWKCVCESEKLKGGRTDERKGILAADQKTGQDD